MKSIILLALSIFGMFYSLPVFSQNEEFKSLTSQGNECISNKDYSKAVELFEKAFYTGTDDDNDLMWYSAIAGICAQRIDEPLKALSFFQIAIDLNSQDQDVYNQFFSVAEQLKDKEKQEYVLLKAFENGINNKVYLNKLVFFYYQTGQYDKAIKAVDEFLKITPPKTDILTIKAIALEMTNQPDSAAVVYEKVLTLDPDNRIAVSNLGMIFHQKGNAIYDSARADYMKLKNPTKEQYALMTKKFDEASIFYRKAIPLLEKNPAEPHIKDALNKSYTRIRNAEKANILN